MDIIVIAVHYVGAEIVQTEVTGLIRRPDTESINAVYVSAKSGKIKRNGLYEFAAYRNHVSVDSSPGLNNSSVFKNFNFVINCGSGGILRPFDNPVIS